MVNEINKTREWIEKRFDVNRILPEEHLEEISPCGKYRLVIDAFATADDPTFPLIAEAVVRLIATGEVAATIKRNDSRCFHAWISRDAQDYLVFPEDLEGQTIIDLTARKIESFVSPDDSFIWAEFYPSPNKKRLAIVGCHWACSYEIVVYDFEFPMKLPLPQIIRFSLPGNDANFDKWISENTLNVVNKDGSSYLFHVP